MRSRGGQPPFAASVCKRLILTGGNMGFPPEQGGCPQAIPDHPGFLAVAGSPVVDGAAADLVGAAVIREGWRVFCGVRKAGVRRRLKGRVGVGEGLLRAAGRAGFARDRPRAVGRGFGVGHLRGAFSRRVFRVARTEPAEMRGLRAIPGTVQPCRSGMATSQSLVAWGRGFARFRRARPRPALPRCRSAGHRLWSRSVVCG